MTGPVEGTVYEDEIDLRALVGVLLKRKYLILGLTGAAIAVALLMSTLVLSPVFESDLRLFLPELERDLAMSPQQYAQYAVSDPVLEPLRTALAPDVSPKDWARKFSVSLEAGNTVLEVTVSADTAEESQKLASLWLTAFTSGIYDYAERRLTRALVEAEANVAALRDGLAALGDALGLERSQRDLALEIASAAAYGQEYGDALREHARLLELRDHLAALVEPGILMGPTLPTAPSSPRIILNAVVATVLGVMIGVFVAFGIEWWHGNGSEKDEQPASE